MKILIVGLGSMGKRRVRCLQHLKQSNIVGYDTNLLRAQEAKSIYSIDTISSLNEIDFETVGAIIISTPPDIHEEYIQLAVQNKISCFVEAGVVYNKLPDLIKCSITNGCKIIPSATLLFHPAINIIQEFIQSERFGKACNFQYHSGQYLPDWHPWEKITDFYVGQKETGGAREIVTFELNWLCHLFGMPEQAKCIYGKSLDLGVDIDDTYATCLQYQGVIGNVLIDVVSRAATRQLTLNFSKGQLRWDWNENYISVFNSETQELEKFEFEVSNQAHEGYHSNIIEEMYFSEIKNFLHEIGLSSDSGSDYPHSIQQELETMKLLQKLEG